MSINSIEMALLKLDGNFFVTEISKSLVITSLERFSGQKEMRNGIL